MIREAIADLGGPTTNVRVRDWILAKYRGTNKSTIQAQIVVCTVNHPSRVHYPENKRPRLAGSQYDFLFRVGRGELEQYDPQRHGQWSIIEQADGTLLVSGPEDSSSGKDVNGREGSAAEIRIRSEDGEELDPEQTGAFAQESHLRDFLARNLELLELNLSLFADDSGRTGVEYGTSIGRIDLLAQDKDENFVVIELKVSRGSDAVIGQILRYMNWVRRNLAGNKSVRGIVLAQNFDDRLQYAVMSDESITLRQYRLTVEIVPVDKYPTARTESV
jgi:hypothetical protein